MKHILIKSFFLVAALIVLSACGKDKGGSDSSGPVIQEQVAEGSYRAILRPLNNSLSGYLPTGAAEIDIEAEDVQVKTYLDDDAKVVHMQSIHTGTRCPNQNDDGNADGIVDIEEAYRAVGEVLIPLDSDLDNSKDDVAIYPLGGGFTYEESAALAMLQTDVQDRVNQKLNLGGRVVLIHGVNGGTQMPETVATRDGLLKQASVPIACGILKRLPEENSNQ